MAERCTASNEGDSADPWARWLLRRRHGGDPQVLAAGIGELRSVRDRVLREARLRQGDTMLDVGAGDGLIAFGALELVGASGRVIFSDVSAPLLDHCHTLAEEAGVAKRWRELRISARLRRRPSTP